jgi:hypothetical protein
VWLMLDKVRAASYFLVLPMHKKMHYTLVRLK